MNKKTVKIVIGANYGDEGKGLATEYFSRASNLNNEKCLNILYSGGPQRGHTVELKSGYRHVFHHFGSGTLHNADTYFGCLFMVNPIVFVDEATNLQLSEMKNKFFINPKCRVITPYDVFINRIVEKSRGNNRHGSCGCGIWETEIRYKESTFNLKYENMISLNEANLKKYLKEISYIYAVDRLKFDYGIDLQGEIVKEYKPLFESDGLIDHYIGDLRIMQQMTKICDSERQLFDEYNSLIFEGSQGLALDCDNKADAPHITVGSVGSNVPIDILKSVSDFDDFDIEICYVTRSYFTRHGNGNFPTECDYTEINKSIYDITNIPNEYQGTLRYGRFDAEELLDRVRKDRIKAQKMINKIRSPRVSLMFTHLNEDTNCINRSNMRELYDDFSKWYLSNSKYAEDIIDIKL